MRPPGTYRMLQQLFSGRILQDSNDESDINYGSPIGGLINVKLLDKDFNNVI